MHPLSSLDNVFDLKMFQYQQLYNEKHKFKNKMREQIKVGGQDCRTCPCVHFKQREIEKLWELKNYPNSQANSVIIGL